MGQFVLRARWVVPVSRNPIPNGWVHVDGSRIRAVGGIADRPPDLAIEDLGQAALLPGFVNAHTHLELSSYAGRIAPQPFWSWIEALIALRRSIGVEAPSDAIVRGAKASLLGGVTCVGDISRCGANVAALAGVPIRKVCFIELISGAARPGTLHGLCEVVSEARANADELTTIGISPHALYSVSDDDLRGMAALAVEQDLPLTMHVAETTEEIEWLRGERGAPAEFRRRYLPRLHDEPRGSWMEILERAGIAAVHPLLVHLNYTGDEELRRMRGTGASVAFCPRAAQYFGHSRHRWREFRAAGINVAIGTDSLASNATLSILDELNALRRTTPDMTAAEWVELGTRCGATALRVERDCGTIDVGKNADFTSLRLPDSAVDRDFLDYLFDDATTVNDVWVAGQRVVRNGAPAEALVK